jgi:hypothetical protein
MHGLMVYLYIKERGNGSSLSCLLWHCLWCDWWCRSFYDKLAPVRVLLLSLSKNLSLKLEIEIKGAARNFCHMWRQLRLKRYTS